MDKDVRNRIQHATQDVRALLEREFGEQLEGLFDIRLNGTIAAEPGAHLTPSERVVRTKLVAAVEHFRSGGASAREAVARYQREAAFTTLNRFVALKMLEARQLLQECVSRGDQSTGFREFSGLAPGLALLPDRGYRLYIECIFDEVGREVGVLFDRRDPTSLLWPRRNALLDLLAKLNAPDLAEVWSQDETIGWVYQFFNSGDERRQMRDESSAPRNSRELAVRNQFFTPRYVVQFLTDNTLGRTWYQMTAGQTALTERWEYFVHDEGADEHRTKKDPRDLRILDPSCGSGHFLLYAFDLLLGIYEEAWGDLTWPRGEGGTTLGEDYADLPSLRRALPALVLEHNLHGVEIDPRAGQIAALALWLRAQRAYQEFGVAGADRTPITRTHIVIAEPMPGDQAMVDEFAAGLQPPLLRDLFCKMVGEMRLAGELGSLLQVERAIASELHRARAQFSKERAEVRPALPGLEPARRRGALDLSGIDDDAFFHEAEARMIEALHRFAESTSGGAGVRRRLFAGDAAQGVALIELLRAKFDVVLMNPPFGAGSLVAKQAFEKSYPRTKNDLYAAFVERGIQLLHRRGMLGAITSRTGFFLSSFQKWREEVLLQEAPPVVFADLGYGVLDSAMVEVAAYCLEKARDRTQAIFLCALEAADKASDLLEAIRTTSQSGGSRFELEPQSFRMIPKSPFAYWAGKAALGHFRDLPSLEGAVCHAAAGAQTRDNPRFVRASWEVSPASISAPRGTAKLRRAWVPLAKGGSYGPFYADVHLLVQWALDGRELKAATGAWRASKGWGDYWRAAINSIEYYGRPGITWPVRSQKGFSARALGSDAIFGHKGPTVFVTDDGAGPMGATLALMNSRAFGFLVSLQMAFGAYEVGVVQRTPFPHISVSEVSILATLATRAWRLKRRLDSHAETSHSFLLPSLLQVTASGLPLCVAEWGQRVGSIDREFASLQFEIDERCFELYGIDQPNGHALLEGAGAQAEAADDDTSDDDEWDDVEESLTDTESLTAELVSWTVGVAFGRFDVRLATGERALPDEPDPFDPLPVCAPGMLTGNDGLPATAAPNNYPIAFPTDGILVDDPGHPRDLTAGVHAVFETVFRGAADARWREAAELLDPKERDLRNWLSRGLFEHHLKRYSKSRRKAPILWQLATASTNYSVWLYAHRLTADSLFQLQTDVIGPRLAAEERRHTALVQAAGPNPSANQRREIAAVEAFVDELRTLLAEVSRVAPLWHPDLDDGVVLTMAPLWRLVPQHRAWQRELKSAWDALCAGKYDWAHLAMHLWPERVVPKCATDRSLAIAHDLEDVFWVEDAKGKWQPRSTPARSIEELVRERTSPAVKAALQSLLDAPAVASGGRGRARAGSSRRAG